MKGVICEKAGEKYQVVDNLETPEPSPDQLLVKSIYAAINPAYVYPSPPDLFIRLCFVCPYFGVSVVDHFIQ